MPTVRGLSHVVIHVRDLEKMVGFYRDVLGMTVTHQHPGHMVFLTPDPKVEDHMIALFTAPMVDESETGVLAHHCWRVDTVQDAKDFYHKFKENNVPIKECVSYAYPWDEQCTVSCYFDDPEGNHVEIQAILPLDPEIPNRTTCLIDFEQSVEEISGRAQRKIEAPLLSFGGARN
jgi:catechol-2,3-dioxygenase